MSCKFYIFRHGQSTYNVLGVTQGHTNDSVLTDKGRAQAKKVGKILKGKGVEVIVTSPLGRAVETAEIANKHIGCSKIIKDKCFIEVNVGEVEGWHPSKIQEVYGEIYDKWRSNKDEHSHIAFKGGESKGEVRDRILKGLRKYAKKGYKTIAVSGHGITLSQVLLSMGHRIVDIPNGAVAHFDHDGKSIEFNGFITDKKPRRKMD